MRKTLFTRLAVWLARAISGKQWHPKGEPPSVSALSPAPHWLLEPQTVAALPAYQELRRDLSKLSQSLVRLNDALLPLNCVEDCARQAPFMATEFDDLLFDGELPCAKPAQDTIIGGADAFLFAADEVSQPLALHAA